MVASTVWAQLSAPDPAEGSIPFVDTDDISIITDVLNFSYVGPNVTPDATKGEMASQLFVRNGVRVAYADSSAAPGAAVINKPSGRAAIAVGAASVVITSDKCRATSMVSVSLETNDATLTSVKSVIPADGSFTVTGNAAATAAVKFSFNIINRTTD